VLTGGTATTRAGATKVFSTLEVFSQFA
jgi:hypothetical protein